MVERFTFLFSIVINIWSLEYNFAFHYFLFQLYTESEDVCMTTFGMYHPLMMRIHMNFGICWEESGNVQKAYDYFRKNYEITLEVFGKNHITVRRPVKILAEPMYQRISRERGDTVLTQADYSG